MLGLICLEPLYILLNSSCDHLTGGKVTYFVTLPSSTYMKNSHCVLLTTSECTRNNRNNTLPKSNPLANQLQYKNI